MHEVITYIVSAIVPAIGGAILYFLKRHFKQIEKQVCETEERQTRKDILILKNLNAIRQLTVANAIAVKNGHTNGELEEAKKECDRVDKELHDFLIENATKSMKRGK